MVNGHQKAKWGKNWIYKEKQKELANLVVCVYIYIIYRRMLTSTAWCRLSAEKIKKKIVRKSKKNSE